MSPIGHIILGTKVPTLVKMWRCAGASIEQKRHRYMVLQKDRRKNESGMNFAPLFLQE